VKSRNESVIFRSASVKGSIKKIVGKSNHVFLCQVDVVATKRLFVILSTETSDQVFNVSAIKLSPFIILIPLLRWIELTFRIS